MFQDREEAGERLAEACAGRVEPGALVLGIPRGGVIVALVVARSLGADLDVVVPHKLGAPGNPELAVGAVMYDGTVVLDEHVLTQLKIDRAYPPQEIARQRVEIERRLRLYRGVPEEADPAGRECVVVDDGMATGATADAAIRSLIARGAKRVVLAVPVAPRQAIDRARSAGAEVVCLESPEPFFAVGQWYETFGQISDDEVLAGLRKRL